MKKIIISLLAMLIFALAVSITVSAESMIINPDDPGYGEAVENAAKELFGKMNFSQNEKLSETQALYNSGKYDEALSAYKKIWFEQFAEKSKNKIMETTSDAKLSDEATVKSLMEEYKAVISDRGMQSFEFQIKPGSIDWGQSAELDGYGDGDLHAEFTNMYFTACLAGAYMNTDSHNPAYLDRWLDIWFDYDMNYNTKGSAAELYAQEYNYSGFISCLKLERYKAVRFGVLNLLCEYNYDEVISRMNNVQFAHMLLRTLSRMDKVHLYLNQPNQSISGCQATVSLYAVMTDFDCAKERMLLALDRFQYNMYRNYLPDGMDVEQDLKYNNGYIINTLAILNALKTAGVEPPKALTELLESCVWRIRAILSTATHDGKYPNIADTYSTTSAETEQSREHNKELGNDYLINQLISTIEHNGEYPEPAFTSIAFPYAGHYIMRKDWSPASQYLYFKGNRWSGGHTCDANLGIMFFANGERLLIDSGGNTYGEMDIGDYIEYSYAHNTVTVDGLTQFWQYLDNVDVTDASTLKTPIDGIWHTNDRFDFATAKYTDGYSSDRNHYRNNVPMKEVNDVTHKRTVINDKENEIAVVYDRLDSSLAHTFNINWNYSHKFNDYGTVFANAQNKSIKSTLDDQKAGVDIYNFTQNDISYEVDCGEYGGKDGRDMSGWSLPDFGVDYKPIVHVSTYFEGNSSQQGVLSLIVPKVNNENPLKNVETICNNQGFKITKNDGTVITCVGGQRENTQINTGDFKLNAKQFYLVEKPDGTAWGMVYGANTLICKGKRYSFRQNSFEFSVKNGKVIYEDTMSAPATFEWIETSEGLVPGYGPDPDNTTGFRY